MKEEQNVSHTGGGGEVKIQKSIDIQGAKIH